MTNRHTRAHTNRCPECSWGDIDFGISGDGRWDVEWEFVACPEASTTFHFEGSHGFYWKVQVRGTKTPVETLRINDEQAARTDDNFFILQNNSGQEWGTNTVKITTVGGVTETHEVSP